MSAFVDFAAYHSSDHHGIYAPCLRPRVRLSAGVVAVLLAGECCIEGVHHKADGGKL